MKINKLTISISLAIFSTFAMAESKPRLLIFKDLASYQDKESADLDQRIIELPDTAVLDSFKYQVFEDGKRVPLKEVKILESSEENIFTINEGRSVVINDNPPEILISNGGDFVKTKASDSSRNLFARYTPKSKIESIQFEKDINSKNHLAQIVPFRTIEDAELHYTYAMGDINWQAKYNLHLMDGNLAKFDYFIEIDNGTQKEFKDINLTISSEAIERVFRDYNTGDKQFLFTQNNPIVVNGYGSRENQRRIMKAEAYADSMEVAGLRSSHQTETETVMGRDYIVFSNPVSISSNAKISLDYDIDNGFEYIKRNKWNIQYHDKKYRGDTTMNPYLSIQLKREGDKDSMPLSVGTLSVFAGEAVGEATFLKEQGIGEHGKRDDLYVNIGQNNSIEIKNTKIKEESFDIFSEDLINDYDFRKYVKGNAFVGDRSNLKKVFKNRFTITKTRLNIKTNDIAKDESLVVSRDRFTLDEESYNKVKKILLLAQRETAANDNFSTKDLSDLLNEMSRILERTHTFDEQDLRAGVNEEMYILSINKSELPRLVFYENGIPYLGDVKLEDYKK